MNTEVPIIVIVGQTASGKSALAMNLASRYGGEIVAADSRTIYKGMDIGTAKPSSDDQRRVPHHCIDLITPDQSYSAAIYKKEAEGALEKITAAGSLPIIVGGSGLYIDSLLYDYEFGEEADPELRSALAALSLEELQARARATGIDVGSDVYRNKRHLARYLERGGKTPSSVSKLPSNILLLGLEVERDTLHSRIEARVESMIGQGLVDEVESLLRKWGRSSPGMQAPGYKAFAGYVSGEWSMEEAKNMFIMNDKKLAKRQKAWFQRNNDIRWVKSEQETESIVQEFLERFGTITV